MSQTRIEQIIDEIYEFVEGCKTSPLSQTKIIVPKDQLLDLIDELKRRTPDEIRRYQKIIANRESIVQQAEEQAKQIIEEANQKAKQLLDESVIMQQAYAQANELIQNARDESERLTSSSRETAENIHVGVLSYADDILNEIETMMSQCHDEIKRQSDAMVDKLKTDLGVIQSNRREILEQLRDAQTQSDHDALPEPVAEEDVLDDDFPMNDDELLKSVD